MNSVIDEYIDMAYQIQMGRARVLQNISIVSKPIHTQIHYNSPVHGDKEVRHHGKGKGF
jgi:hypothetical protein